MKYIDTHSHVYFEQYDNDRDEVFKQMHEGEVTTIAIGTNLETSKQASMLAKNRNDVVLGATIGVHPNNAQKGFDVSTYKDLLDDTVVGVGECGLDYFRTPKPEVYETQRPVFEAQIEFALEHNLPLMLHIRPSKGSDDAHEDALAILSSYKREHGDVLRGTAHFFTGSLDIAKRYWELGFHTSISGVVTFAPELQEVVRAAPLNLLLSETDAPYAAPVPHRGKRNEPAFVEAVVEHIAGLRSEPETQVRAVLVENAIRLFNIAN